MPDIDRLEAEIRRRRNLERELAQARRDLQQVRRELANSRADERRVRHTAYHDSLTGLPNRRSFEEHSGHAMQRQAPQTREFALLYIDLDGFKSVNDVHGHAVGDELLKVIGARLTQAVRADDTVSRHGGDEFLCLLLDVQDEEQVAAIARKLFDAVSAPCQLGRLSLCARPSIGVALYPRDGLSVEALLESADSAMFWAKKHRLGHAFFSQLPSAARALMAGPAHLESAVLRLPTLREAGGRIPS
jgi:diguanylate cyclase (GGDEF)-like protein